MITIRNEEEKDRAEVEDVIRKAFWNLYVPGCNEHYLAHIMRSHPDFLPELDFVIELDGKIIGSIMYTRNKLIEENGNEKNILTFGPVCILPEHQRRGYGKQLLEHSFERAAAAGYDVIVIFGSPNNYVSRGFKSCKKFNVCTEDGTFPAAMLIKELKPGTLENGKKYVYRPSPVLHLTKRKPNALMPDWKRWKRNAAPDRKNFTFYPKPLYRNLLCRLIKRHLHKTRSFSYAD